MATFTPPRARMRRSLIRALARHRFHHSGLYRHRCKPCRVGHLPALLGAGGLRLHRRHDVSRGHRHARVRDAGHGPWLEGQWWIWHPMRSMLMASATSA